MSTHESKPVGRRLRGGSLRYAVPNAAGAGAAKFRENLRRLGGEDLMDSRAVAATAGPAPRLRDSDGR